MVINHRVLSLLLFTNCFHALQLHMNLADAPSVIQRLMSGITCLSIYKTILHTFLQKHINNLQRTTVADIAIWLQPVPHIRDCLELVHLTNWIHLYIHDKKWIMAALRRESRQIRPRI